MAKGKVKQNKVNGTLLLLGPLLIVSLVCGVIYMNKLDLSQRLSTYVEREEALEREISDEEERSLELEEKKKYMATDKYIKDVAREKLGLVDPGEVLIKAR